MSYLRNLCLSHDHKENFLFFHPSQKLYSFSFYIYVVSYPILSIMLFHWLISFYFIFLYLRGLIPSWSPLSQGKCLPVVPPQTTPAQPAKGKLCRHLMSLCIHAFLHPQTCTLFTKHFLMYVIPLILTTTHQSGQSHFHLKKIRKSTARKMKWLAQDHSVNKWQN